MTIFATSSQINVTMPRKKKTDDNTGKAKGGEAKGKAEAEAKAAEKSWRKSEAKKLLAQDIIDGLITSDDNPEEVFFYRPEYAASTQRLWKGRLTSLLAAITSAHARAIADEGALLHDRGMFAAPSHNYRGEPRWDGSAAQGWLKIDVAAGLHEQLKPKELQKKRRAYLQYPLDVFRDHIYQEVRFQKFVTWRNDTNQAKANQWKC